MRTDAFTSPVYEDVFVSGEGAVILVGIVADAVVVELGDAF